MNKLIIVSLLLSLNIPMVFSQKGDHINGGHFLKKIEYNIMRKSNVEKLFFGDFNAPVEFFFNPSNEYNPCVPSGIRIFRELSKDFYTLEVKFISNYNEASNIASEVAREKQMRQIIDIPVKLLDSLPREVFNQIWDANRIFSDNSAYLKIYFEELDKHFKVEVNSFHVSDQFAEKLYDKMVSLIDNFKGKVVPRNIIILDGYSVTFRTVIEDELWSLYIHMPQGYARKMTDFCRQIIEDAQNDQLDEKKYMDFLDAFEM